MKPGDCRNVEDFRQLARARLPYPVFHYIDGAADDEITRDRNTAAYDDCDLVPNVLAGVESVDLRTTVMGREIAMPLFLAPTALQRLFHWQGERGVGAAAAKFGTFFGISSLATVGIEEIGRTIASTEIVPALRPQGQGAEPRDDRAVQSRQLRRDRADRRYDRRGQS